MASLKDIRIRIASVKSTRKITSAMKVVSAAKFHKAQDAESRFQVYMDRFTQTLGMAMRDGVDYVHPLMVTSNPDAPVCILAFSSNSSLCGAYNQNVIGEAKRLVAELRGGAREVVVHAFGKKMVEGLRREGIGLAASDEDLVAHPSFTDVVRVYDALQRDFLAGVYSELYVVYNKFHNPAFQESVHARLLPVVADSLAEQASGDGQASRMRTEYLIEPSPKEFFDFALPHMGRLQLYSYVLNNYVGEHGARMTAMSQATDNADTLVSELTLEYNKARQAAITSEILEIVSGANALQS
ncbi:MAG: ATP synthase F1 subunit gamma [Bacteroidia bacterium]|nr:MAG: ATP synthase F1 subunit gamma [Bacteroidia bacterium]